MELNDLVERVSDIRRASPSPQVRVRVQEAAQELSRAGDLRMHLDLALEAIAALISILYETDEDGQPANYDQRTGRILLPVPWGSAGWRKWQLRKWEANVLRSILLQRLQERRRFPPLFDHNFDNHRWYLNHADYPDPAAALAWLKRAGPSLAEWRSAAYEYRLADAKRRRKSSGA